MHRRVLPYAFLAFAATATAGGVALNRLLDRPGESAFAFVPANALGVASFDLVPAPDQVLAFKHIEETLSEINGPTSKNAGSFLSQAVPEPALRPLLDQVDRSVALAWLPSRDGKKSGIEGGEGVGFVALKDPVAFMRSLKQKAKAQKVEGTTVYWMNSKELGKAAIMVQDRYAVVSDTAWPLIEVSRVARGDTKAITTVPAFAAARTKALASSNLLVMMQPEVVQGEDWFVGSMAIRETGMEFAVNGHTQEAEVKKAGSLVPLGSHVLTSLPRGAYGFLAAAQPGPAMALSGEALDEPAKGMKEELDIDMKADMVPAMSGNTIFGFYPSFGPDAGIDLLVVMDDSNGADPAKLARKLEKAIDGKMDEEGSPEEWKVVTHAPDGTEMRRLADEPVEDMRKGLREAEKSFFRPLTLSRGKTIAWTTVGNSVLFATSQSLLERAVASRKSPSMAAGLSGDSAFGAQPAAAADGQVSFAMSMKRLAEGIRNTIDPSHMSVDMAKVYRKTLGLFDGVTEPLALRAKIEPNGHYNGYISVPFDWSKLPGFFK